MTTSDIDRRRILKAGGALGLLGAAGSFASQLAAAGAAAAAVPGDYKALVCIYLYGGNDGHNTVLATDAGSWGRYFAARNTGFAPIALMPVGTLPVPIGQISAVTGRPSRLNTPESWGGVLPIAPASPQIYPLGSGTVRTFAFHPFLAPMQSLFNQGRLAVVANIGTLIEPTTKAQYLAQSVPVPRSLFSHFDQQGSWQAGASLALGVGWGGAMADTVVNANGSNAVFTAVAPSGAALPGGLSLFLAGRTARRYAIATGPVPADLIGGIQGSSLFNSNAGPGEVSALIEDTNSTSNLANDYADVTSRSISAASLINSAVSRGAAAAVPAAPNYVNPFTGESAPNPVAQQLQAVAKQIAAGPGLGLSRQVFFVTMSSFDTHHTQNFGQPDLLGQLAQALAYFDGALSNIGGADIRSKVTTFTASDFGRSFTMNGSGTDHAWGSHAFVMGGAVNGGNIYGDFPTLGVDSGGFSNPDMAGNALVPKISVDQYGATLGAWMGVSSTDLANIFPNLGNFSPTNLGFV